MFDTRAFVIYKVFYLKTIPKRYANLFKIVYENNCKRILEIGTNYGTHAYQMIRTASIRNPINQIEYYGIDLFDLFTEADYEAEFSKRPPSIEQVRNRLTKTGVKIRLYKGNSKDVLPQCKDDFGNLDFIFIDGGHHVETVNSDWENVEKLMSSTTIVVFDDYYTGVKSEMSQFGCQNVINALNGKLYNVEILDPVDKFSKIWGELRINMVKVTLKKAS